MLFVFVHMRICASQRLREALGSCTYMRDGLKEPAGSEGHPQLHSSLLPNYLSFFPFIRGWLHTRDVYVYVPSSTLKELALRALSVPALSSGI